MVLRKVVSAELSKLRTVPISGVAAAGTVIVGAAIAAALAASAAGQGAAAPAADAVLQAVPFAQAGIILLGILPAALEHQGGQFRTTLTAVPNRGLLLAGKSIGALIAVAVTAVLSVGVALAAAVLAQGLVDAPSHPADQSSWTLIGAAVYLALIGMLAHAVALLLRQLVPALVTMLVLILVVPFLLGGITEHVRWLPDRAGSLLYVPDADAVLMPVTGALVLVAWIAATGAAATVAFLVRDG